MEVDKWYNEDDLFFDEASYHFPDEDLEELPSLKKPKAKTFKDVIQTFRPYVDIDAFGVEDNYKQTFRQKKIHVELE